ncbi:MAG TPA: hypothetical protein VMH87_02945 [Pseudomonadales bacterium]|nr:hypothetical protein [Pseudomonadales bacterium]
MKANVKRSTIAAAYIIAIGADALEVGLAPVMSEGFVSPLNNIVDVVACIILTLLLGWHIAFLPSFMIKLLPVVDFAPTWTLAVLIATRAGRIAENDVPPPITGNPKSGVVDVEATVQKPPPVPPGK